MKLVYAHFPINAIPENDGASLQIRNFRESDAVVVEFITSPFHLCSPLHNCVLDTVKGAVR